MNKLLITQIILLMILFISCQEKPPVDLDRLENIPNPAALPSEAPKDWLLAHIDVETTGLVPGYHEMIDIGIAMTDLEGELIDTLFLRIQPDYPERLSPGAYEVNAFNVKKWQELGALSSKAAVDSIVAFHHRVAAGRTVLFVAYNSHFDSAFLDHLFRKANRTWRELYYYFVLDIPSMAWGLGLRDLTSDQLMARYNIQDEPHTAELHTGITGALVNVRIYRALLRYREEMFRQNQ